MKKMILIVVLIWPGHLWAQYFGERVTEKSFEQSSLYFTSHFLNTYGLNRFQSVAVGLIDDPFLDLQINPANLPELGEKSTLLYVDFRGDRTPVPISDFNIDYGVLATDDVRIGAFPYYDPRWFTQTRSEPEPVFSFGVLNAIPLASEGKLVLGATYQIIHKNEPFYTLPSWIFNPRAGFDALGERVADVPIVDRFSAEDEMVNSGHLLSSNIGLSISKSIDLGVGANAVIHSRDGGYLRSVLSPFGSSNPWQSDYLNSRQRVQDYNHLDLNGGLRVHFSPRAYAGIKLGYLSGDADQTFRSEDNSRYDYQNPDNSENHNSGLNESLTTQSWGQKGHTRYGRVHFSLTTPSRGRISGYLRVAEKTVDLSNQSAISDTSFYTYHWQYDNRRSYYASESALRDTRFASGRRKQDSVRGMLNTRWQLGRKTEVTAGFFFSAGKTNINSTEPVSVSRFSTSENFYSQSGPDTTHHVFRLTEEKTLFWQYRGKNWQIKLPILLKFTINPSWKILTGISRTLRSWDITETTTAIFQIRERIENAHIDRETNFGERYSEPRDRTTENFTDFLAGMEVAVSEDLEINLLVNPEFENRFRFSQWWLGFRSRF